MCIEVSLYASVSGAAPVVNLNLETIVVNLAHARGGRFLALFNPSL